ncbi:MAG: aldehyde dehydrogenase family protein [Syntrophaceae bacterium]
MPMNKDTVPLKSSRWSSQRGEDRFVVENPATGEAIAMVQGGGAAEIDAAVQAAHQAFNAHWRWVPAQVRGQLLKDCGRLIREYSDELAKLECHENGKPIWQAYIDIDNCATSFEYFGGLTGNLPGVFLDFGPVHCSVFLEPYGVVGGILPFNWPPVHTAAKSAPALAVGNTVVLKPGEQAPLTVMRIVELLQTVLPPDVIHVVPGVGPIAGQALAGHPLVRKLSFTGATKTGVAVLKLTAETITPAMLELGGKNPLIIFDDAELPAAVNGAVEGAFYNQGEACTATARIIVQRAVHDEVVLRMSEIVRRLRVGDGADFSTHVGPMVTRSQQQRVLEYIGIGRKEGAIIAAQAVLPADERLKNGFWAPPTLFIQVRPDMRIAREEIFGPVTCVIPFDTPEEAVAIANATDYGLVAGVYTRNHELAMRVARRIEAGIVYVNNYYRGGIGGPFGGVKGSGFGREHSIETLSQYGYSKAVRSPSGIGPIPQWIID